MNITQTFLLVVILIILFYDLFIFIKKGNEFTVSKVVYVFSMANPIVPFLFGVVCGHIFWGQVK